MKIVYPICCGMDVHKRIIVATIAATSPEGVTSYEQRTFSTFNSDLAKLREWLVGRNCRDACMESTGKYWIPIWNALEPEIRLTLAHPKYTKAIKGKKTDKKDSKWIADLFKHDLVPGSFIPPRDVREMRDLSRYRFKLTCAKVAEKNRIQNCMTMSNIRIDSVVSDPFGKSATLIMGEILSNPGFRPEDAAKHLKSRLKAKADEVASSLEGLSVPDDQKVKMEEAYAHIAEIDAHISRIEGALEERAAKYEAEIALLSTIPGLQRRSIIAIISETGADMSRFSDEKHFSSWAGVAPTNNESAGKKKSVRISHAGTYLKPLLVQVALNSIRDKSDNYFSTKYSILKKRRGHKKAIVAIARMILVCIYHMLSAGEAFNPRDAERLSDPVIKEQPAPAPIAEAEAVELLKSLGYTVTR